MDAKVIVSFFVRHNSRIQIVLICLIIIMSVVMGLGIFDLQGIMLPLLVLIAFEVVLNNIVIDNQIIDAENNFYFYPDDSLMKMLKLAKHDVYIIAVTCINMNDFSSVISELTERGVQVNFLLCEAEAIESMCKFSYSNKKKLESGVKNNMDKQSTINRILAAIEANQRGNMEKIRVRILDSFMATSFVAVDLEEGLGKIQCTYYQYHMDSHECPCMKFDEKIESSKESVGGKVKSAGVYLDAETRNWYKYYKNIILDMWKDGNEWNTWKS